MELCLHAYIASQKVGELRINQENRLEFKYVPEWLISKDSHPISLSMPLTTKPYKGKKTDSYFYSLARLPMDQNIPPITVLQKLRTECPGGLSFHINDQMPESDRGKYTLLNQTSFHKFLTTGEDAGNILKKNELGQNVISIMTHQGNLYLPKDASPTMYYLKMPSEKYPGLIENEFTCMKLAEALGLRVTKLNFQQLERSKYLMVARSDRFYVGGKLRIIHQETFAQSLGATSSTKNQLFSYKNCLKLINDNSFYPARDKMQFVKLMVYNLLIGNTQFDCGGISFNIDRGSISLSNFSGLYSAVLYDEPEFESFKIPFQGASKLEDLDVEKLKAFCRVIALPYKFFHKELMGMAGACMHELNAILVEFHQDPFLDFQTLDKLKIIISKRCQLIKERF